MKIVEEYSHLNAREHLQIRHKGLYKEVVSAIEGLDAGEFSKKPTKRKAKDGRVRYDSSVLARAFDILFGKLGWEKNQTDLFKDQVAVEVQLGRRSFFPFDLFAKHLMLYSQGVINLGIEILPTKKMQSQMSSGVAYYEGEVYNVLRHGRNNPPVPLLILGIEPD